MNRTVKRNRDECSNTDDIEIGKSGGNWVQKAKSDACRSHLIRNFLPNKTTASLLEKVSDRIFS